MTERVKIYAVTAGSYSDYHVEFLTLDKKVADQAVKMGAGDSVEQFRVLDKLPEKVIVQKASAWVDKDGEGCRHHLPGGTDVSVWSFGVWDYEDYGDVTDRPRVRDWTCGCGKKCTGIEAVSTSSNASAKACADRLGQLRAERLGIG